MGARGPQPTPTATLQARGSWRAKEREGEVSYPPGKTAPPAHLEGEAKREWKRVVKQLAGAGVFADVDRALLCMYCESWAEYAACAAQIAEKGMFIRVGADAEGRGGEVRLSPLLKVRDRAAERAIQLAGHFGFSPSTRTRIKAPPREGGAGQPAKLRFFSEDGAS